MRWGVQLVPKLKYEHVHLNPFLKMHVDLAAQVQTSPTCGQLRSQLNNLPNDSSVTLCHPKVGVAC